MFLLANLEQSSTHSIVQAFLVIVLRVFPRGLACYPACLTFDMSQSNASLHPDADLHPHASGEALNTVEAHQQEVSLKLYAGWFCPFVQRTWLVLEEKEIPYQYIEVNPYHKPDSLMKLNPRGLVPTLEHDNKPLFESGIINEFLEDAYPTHGPKLRSDDPHERARQRIFTDFVSTRVIPAFHRFLQFQEGNHEGTLEEKREDFLKTLRDWTAEMHPEGPYFGGGEPNLVDFQMAPWAVSPPKCFQNAATKSHRSVCGYSTISKVV